jgi:hypothetical protein
VHDAQNVAVRREVRQRRDHRLVNRPRALRAAEDEEREPIRLAPLRRYLKELAPDGVARHDAFAAEEGERLLERDRRRVGEEREPPVREARQRVRLHDERADPRQRRRQQHRPRHVTARAHHHVRPELADEPARGDKTLRQDHQPAQLARRAHVL